MGAKAGSFQPSIRLQASELATNSIDDRDPEGIPRLKQQPYSPGTRWTPLQAPKSQGYPRESQAHSAGLLKRGWKVEDKWKEKEEEEEKEEASPWWPSQLCSQTDYPPLLSAALLRANAALPHPVGLGALPGVANAVLSLLHRREEWREQEERWCEGKSPGACRPVSGRDLLVRPWASPGLTNGDMSDPGPCSPRSRSLCSSAHLSPWLLGADWRRQAAWVAQSIVKGQILMTLLGLYGAGKL